VTRLALAAAFALAARGACAEPTRLLGTVVSSDAARSVAVVSRGAGQVALREGSDLDGALVVAIRKDELVLRRNGQLVSLRLDDVASFASAETGSFPASPDPAGAEDDGGAGSRAARARGARDRVNANALRSRPAGGSVSRSARSAKASSSDKKPDPETISNDDMLLELAKMARFVPVLDDNGKLRGVAVINLVPDSILEQMGLQSDDVVTSINGTSVDGTDNALGVLRNLAPGQPATIGVERHGAPAKISVPAVWASRAAHLVRK
jgi:type II secretion system protein C